MLQFLALPPLLFAGVVYAAYRGVKKMEGENLTRFDGTGTVFREADPDSPGMTVVNAFLHENFIKPAQAAGATTGWEDKRERFEQGGLARTDCVAEYRDDTIEVDGHTLHGRWTLVDGYDPDRRILYLHGGAFTVGSDVSHRPLTWNLARRTGAAVFAPNYRLMPENERRWSIADARAAYQWILSNGPDGPSDVTALAVSGDSAGGNLALMLSNWVKSVGLRAADAVYALSPSVDSSAASPTFKSNLETDLMLQPLLRPLVKVPRAMLLWGMRKQTGISPNDPDISPVFGDLSDLPPTLVQASSTEMLYGDAERYVGKALEAGSPAKLQSWSNMPHVFQIFDDALPEAHDALDEAAEFLREHGVVKPGWSTPPLG